MARYSPARGAEWIRKSINDSQIAMRGGPVRISIASIVRHASLSSMYVAIRAKGWAIEVIGGHWLIFDPALARGRVVGFAGTEPVVSYRRP